MRIEVETVTKNNDSKMRVIFESDTNADWHRLERLFENLSKFSRQNNEPGEPRETVNRLNDLLLKAAIS